MESDQRSTGTRLLSSAENRYHPHQVQRSSGESRLIRMRKQMLRSIKAGIRTTARNNRKLIEPTMNAIGAVSMRAERKIRQILSLPPSIVNINCGPALISPIRMSTCEGREQIAVLVYYKGISAWEHPFPSLLAEVLISARDGLFFDIGANTGLYSLLSKSVCPKRGVYAFEPFPPVLKILTSNIALNKFAADIVVVDAAASDETGAAELFIPTQEHGLVESSASLSATFKSQHSEIVTVKTVRLDDYYHQAGLVGPVTVMKIDVEGAEERVLSGAAELMARDKPIIFCEILPNSSGWREIPAILAKVSYLRAAILTNTLVAQEGAGPDLRAHNYILFPRNLESVIRKVAQSVNVHYQTYTKLLNA
jgi:FkbM family methyltransferase